MNQNFPETIPGYWKNAQGALVPEDKVKPIDKLRDQLVRSLVEQAHAASSTLKQFKLHALTEVSALVETSFEQYGVKTGGDKGNVTLYSYDGKFKVVRQMQERITFSEQLQAAKALIDKCVARWSEGANDNIRALVNHAFQADREGNISTGRVLGLRRLDIHDEEWQLAMQAIADSMQTVGSKPYVRFYERDDQTGTYKPIALDLAVV